MIIETMSTNKWLEFVKLFAEKNPELSRKDVLQRAKAPYQKLKKQYQRGGNSNIELSDPQLRFEAGVSALNSNMAEIGRPVIFGGNNNIELSDSQLRFEAGVSALNSNMAEIGRSVIFGGESKKPEKPKTEPSMRAQNWRPQNWDDSPEIIAERKQRLEEKRRKRWQSKLEELEREEERDLHEAKHNAKLNK
jgi:hypothetical protein